jgi:7,8-dihydropterin-6-yl-methyl-4-(beta-D-ribofuranosyl)aminobenzene 5'-phosphate synthase
MASWLVVALLTAACDSPTVEPTDAASPESTTAPATTATSVLTSTAAPTSTALPKVTAPPAPGATRITIVCDNTAYDPRLTGAWGFAALVEVSGKNLLFDTGGDGHLLLDNMAALGIDPSALDAVLLSHEHDDHTGGLTALLDTGATPVVYLPASSSSALRESAAAHTEVVAITGPREILPGVFTTGEVGEYIIEQALVVGTDAGNVVVTGCAHPGILEILGRSQELSPGGLALVIGGFHLVETVPPKLARIVAGFRELGVRQVAPTHCTGDTATAAFAWEYGDDLVEAGAGRVIEVG